MTLYWNQSFYILRTLSNIYHGAFLRKAERGGWKRRFAIFKKLLWGRGSLNLFKAFHNDKMRRQFKLCCYSCLIHLCFDNVKNSYFLEFTVKLYKIFVTELSFNKAAARILRVTTKVKGSSPTVHTKLFI